MMKAMRTIAASMPTIPFLLFKSFFIIFYLYTVARPCRASGTSFFMFYQARFLPKKTGKLSLYRLSVLLRIASFYEHMFPTDIFRPFQPFFSHMLLLWSAPTKIYFITVYYILCSIDIDHQMSITTQSPLIEEWSTARAKNNIFIQNDSNYSESGCIIS